jgi:hypothetical protein
VSFVFQWVVGRGKYYIDGPNDGYPVEDEKLGIFLCQNEGLKYSSIVEVVENFNCNSNNTYFTTSSIFVRFSPSPSSGFFSATLQDAKPASFSPFECSSTC